MKGLLRNKANFDVLEGFLTSLLCEPVRIRSLLESESNKEHAADKHNRVDILAENEAGELFIIEVQNTREMYYFHRILYGVSRLITQNIDSGQKYNLIKKVYSISIVYFGLGLGNDYAYHGVTNFKGINDADSLELTYVQQQLFNCETIGGLMPEYYIIRVEHFNRQVKTPLDEWVSFLKTGEIPETAQAPGLAAARCKLLEYELSEAERREYYRHMENMRYDNSVLSVGHIECRMEGRIEGREEGRIEGREEGLIEGMAKGIEKGMAEGIKKGMEQSILIGYRNGFTIEQIMLFFDLNREQVLEIINANEKTA